MIVNKNDFYIKFLIVGIMAYPICKQKEKDYISSFRKGDYDIKKLGEYNEKDRNEEEKLVSNKAFVRMCLKKQPLNTYIIVLDGPEMKTCRYMIKKDTPKLAK